MKILIINPNSDENTNAIIRRKVSRLQYPDTEITVKSLEYMPRLIASYEDAVTAAGGMIKLVKNDTEYDAYIVGCHMDPNLDVLRELTDKPVIGIGEASIRMASMLCSRFSVISPSLNSERRKVKMIHSNYCDVQYCGTKVAKGFTEQDVICAAKEAADTWHMDGIVLGCANYALYDGLIEEVCKVKCFDGIACALMFAVGMIINKGAYHNTRMGD